MAVTIPIIMVMIRFRRMVVIVVMRNCRDDIQQEGHCERGGGWQQWVRGCPGNRLKLSNLRSEEN